MSDNVRQIREVQRIEPDRESVAKRLEEIARQVREGERDVERALLVYYKSNGHVGWSMLGLALTSSEAMGLMEWVKHMIYEDAARKTDD